MTDEATALAKAAQQVHEAARSHKRSEFAHRRQARALMKEYDELRKQCEELGITVVVHQAKKEDLHGRH